jgi:hypothetical protein
VISTHPVDTSKSTEEVSVNIAPVEAATIPAVVASNVMTESTNLAS